MNPSKDLGVLNASNSNIIYETSDLDRGIGLILFEKDGRFQLHIWNEENYDSAIVMDLGLVDLENLYDVLAPFVAKGFDNGKTWIEEISDALHDS